jgi:hypothetical protein
MTCSLGAPGYLPAPLHWTLQPKNVPPKPSSLSGSDLARLAVSAAAEERAVCMNHGITRQSGEPARIAGCPGEPDRLAPASVVGWLASPARRRVRLARLARTRPLDRPRQFRPPASSSRSSIRNYSRAGSSDGLSGRDQPVSQSRLDLRHAVARAPRFASRASTVGGEGEGQGSRPELESLPAAARASGA